MHMPVHSRVGNVLLGVIGLVYIVAAVALLAYAVVQTWNAQSLIDYAVQLVLLAAAGVGLFFVAAALDNLGLHPLSRLKVGHSRSHRSAAAARP